ncbi:MAG: chemotaxis protein CheW [Sulfuricurvum sp.]|nr:chemotaxis protein CheW [Sulfuricurvum sp.]
MTLWDDEDDLDLSIKEGDQYLLFYSNEVLFGISSAKVVEIVEYPVITKVPMTNNAVLGVANIRGNIVGVIDLSIILWNNATSVSARTSLVIVTIEINDEYLNVGLVVDEIFEVDSLPQTDILNRPPFGLTIDKKYIDSIATYKNSYLMLLNLSNVLNVEYLSQGVDAS